MAATISFFRVDNGDMTLLTLQSGKRVLIDCNIRAAADDPDDEAAADVATQLRERLKRDGDDRPYVDVMILSHPDEDHCRGLKMHFHLGPIADYSAKGDKIIIKEMWSSPIVFRRASKDHVLSGDADAWSVEARRRVRQFEDKGFPNDNERILILGKDIEGKTDELEEILLAAGEATDVIGGVIENQFEAYLIAPDPSEGEKEEKLSKNDSSVVVRFKLGSGSASDACRFLTGGDAGVAVWEAIWDGLKDDKDKLTYDLLLAPHHCSWHSLSYDSWSEKGEGAQVSEDARSSLSQIRPGALIVASSKTVKDDESDPPCIRAEREYKDIVGKSKFVCVGDDGPDPLEYVIESGGLKPKGQKSTKSAPSILIGRESHGHG